MLAHVPLGFRAVAPKQPQVVAVRQGLKHLDLGLLSAILSDPGQDIHLATTVIVQIRKHSAEDAPRKRSA